MDKQTSLLRLGKKYILIDNLRSTAVYSGYLKPCLLWVVQTISGRLVYLGWIDVAPGAEALAWHSVAVSSGPGLARHPTVTFGLSCLFVQGVWLAGWLAGWPSPLPSFHRSDYTHPSPLEILSFVWLYSRVPSLEVHSPEVHLRLLSGCLLGLLVW